MRISAQKLPEAGWVVFVYPLAEASEEPLFDEPQTLTAFVTPAIRYSYVKA